MEMAIWHSGTLLLVENAKGVKGVCPVPFKYRAEHGRIRIGTVVALSSVSKPVCEISTFKISLQIPGVGTKQHVINPGHNKESGETKRVRSCTREVIVSDFIADS